MVRVRVRIRVTSVWVRLSTSKGFLLNIKCDSLCRAFKVRDRVTVRGKVRVPGRPGIRKYTCCSLINAGSA